MFKLHNTLFRPSSPSSGEATKKLSQKEAADDFKSRYKNLIKDPSDFQRLQSYLQETHHINLLTDRQIAKIKNRSVAGGVLVGFSLIGYAKIFYAIYKDSR